MDREFQHRQIKNFLDGKYRRQVDSFCLYQWIDRCHFHGWWDLGLSLSSHVPPNSLTEDYHKRLEYLIFIFKMHFHEGSKDSGSKPFKSKGESKRKVGEIDKRRYEFFEQLLSHCNQKTNLFKNVSPVGYQNWITAGAGKSGLLWSIVAFEKSAYVELFFCSSSREINRNRFEIILSHKKEIEDKFGEPLSWEYKNGRKQQYVRSICPMGGLKDQNKWKAIQNDLVDRVIRLDHALKPFIKQLG